MSMAPLQNTGAANNTIFWLQTQYVHPLKLFTPLFEFFGCCFSFISNANISPPINDVILREGREIIRLFVGQAWRLIGLVQMAFLNGAKWEVSDDLKWETTGSKERAFVTLTSNPLLGRTERIFELKLRSAGFGGCWIRIWCWKINMNTNKLYICRLSILFNSSPLCNICCICQHMLTF